MRIEEARVGYDVYCDRLGGGPFRITGINVQTREITVVQSGMTPTTVYAHHCYVPSVAMKLENMRRARTERVARANKIGKPTPRKNR